MCGVVLVLLRFRIIDKTIKKTCFSQWHTFFKSQCVIQRRIQNPIKHLRWSVFRKELTSLSRNYFRKTLHFRYLRGLWIRLCHLWHKFSICMLNQMKRGHIPINVWGFSLRDSSDEDCVFAGLKEFLLVHKFLSLLLNELQQSEIMQKSHSVQNINYIVAVADE